MLERPRSVALVVLVGCTPPPAAPQAPSNRATTVIHAPRLSEWVGCLYARTELRAETAGKFDHLPAKDPFVLLLAAVLRRDEDVHSFVAQIPLDHEPASGESISIEGDMEDSVRESGDIPLPHDIRDPVLVLDHGTFDIEFTSAPASIGFNEFRVRGTLVVADRGRFDVTLAQPPLNPGDTSGKFHADFPVAVGRFKKLSQCSLE